MSSAARSCLIFAAVAGALAVALGAFGAHALQARVEPARLVVWRTAVDYHFYHSLALLAVGILLAHWPHSSALRWSGALFSVGIGLFSGSLYLLVLTDTRWLGAVTPLGGLTFIAAWFLLGWGSWRLRDEPALTGAGRSGSSSPG